ncbi:MAG: acyl-CoA dehydrogenase [Phenylobacterium sp.]|nr:acyl-CoA dehydrogenase [Phenylobacterium sp.]
MSDTAELARSASEAGEQGDLEAFRREVVRFLQENWIDAGDRDPAAFRKKATDAGYLYRSVPRQYGGSEQSPDPWKAYVIRQEFEKVRAPREVGGNGVGLLVPTLIAAGEDWQKEMFVPKTLTGEYKWAQGYSEPGAGSDLAGLRTSAVLVGDEWVINGQKVWTSGVVGSTHMFALVRTEPNASKHAGISYLLLKMDQPGVTVRPLKQITGGTEFGEVFFDDARTPANWIVGKRGEGWEVSRKTIAFERNHISSADGANAMFNQVLKLARTTMLNGQPAIKDPLIRDELGKIHGMVAAHSANGMEQLYIAGRGEESRPGFGAFSKQYNADIAGRIALVAQKIIGGYAMAEPVAGAAGPGRWVNQYFNSIATQLGGGTANMQRNMIAERALGLPRDETA